MAFDFLGTFDADEIKSLLAFADDQLEDVDDRINHLRSQIERLGWITFERDEEGDPISYSIEPDNSELAKYVRIYQFYGGSMLDLPIRSRGEWISYTKGEPTLDDNVEYQGGQIEGAEYSDNFHRTDGVEANTVSKVKEWMIPSIKTKREKWEFRIKRTIDLADQYLEEIILLVKRSTGAETIDDLRAKIEHYLNSDEFVGAGKQDRSGLSR